MTGDTGGTQTAVPEEKTGGDWAPPAVRAAAWMLGAACCFTVMVVLIRMAAERLPVSNILFYRTFIGFLILLPLMLRGGLAGFVPGRLGLYGFRTVAGYGGMLCSFYAYAEIGVAEATSLNATIPLWVVLYAGLFLGEHVGPRRWALTALGFIGALVILRPGFAEISFAAVLALASGAFYGASSVATKALSRTEPTNRLIFYMNASLALVALGPMIAEFVQPRWADLPLVAGVALSGTCAHTCIVRGLKLTDASVVMPFDYARLPLAAVAGWLIFGQALSIWVLIGALIVMTSAIGIIRLEARRKSDTATLSGPRSEGA